MPRDFNDSITGDSSDNKFEGFGGNDTLDGGLGTDTALFSGQKTGYSVTRTGSTGPSQTPTLLTATTAPTP